MNTTQNTSPKQPTGRKLTVEGFYELLHTEKGHDLVKRFVDLWNQEVESRRSRKTKE